MKTIAVLLALGLGVWLLSAWVSAVLACGQLRRLRATMMSAYLGNGMLEAYGRSCVQDLKKRKAENQALATLMAMVLALMLVAGLLSGCAVGLLANALGAQPAQFGTGSDAAVVAKDQK